MTFSKKWGKALDEES